MNLYFFAGFVCEYSYTDLYLRYFLVLIIVIILSSYSYIHDIKPIKNTSLKAVIIGLLILTAVIATHYIYLITINYDIFGCGIFPWIANPI